ncbi:Panacea domain-containing protein [Jannaschia faecimaris]|uniref:Panacea domain-containing protein n=1 Tax=Jannaschia faecimaris TaxID=1244108 RepID=UPI00147C9286|nr:Panacea domain-containing protein [Jannaschia faecimaris]
MSKLADVVAYIADRYPHKSELSKARVTKLVYLSDWKSVQAGKGQLTEIKWYFHNFGPYVDDVIDAARRDPRLKVVSTRNAYGDMKEELQYSGTGENGSRLTSREKEILNAVIEDTRGLYWKGFIKHVYDTPPIKKSQRYTFLTLDSFV